MKKVLSFLLALVMVLSLVPFSSLTVLKANAAEADVINVTLEVTPTVTHAQADAEGNYALTADIVLHTTKAFTLGSLEFSMTPSVTMSYTAPAAGANAIAVQVNDVVDEAGAATGEKKFTYLYDAAALKELAAKTEYKLGTVTLTSAEPFSFSNSNLEATIVGKYGSTATNGETYDLICKLNAYEEGGHDDPAVQWTALSADSTFNASSSAGHYYLTEDYTLASGAFNTDGTNGTVAFKDKTIVICLNGHTLNGSGDGRMFCQSGNTDLTICDCTAHTDIATGELVAGSVTNTKSDGVGFGNAHGAVSGLISTNDKLTVTDVIVDGKGMTGGKVGTANTMGGAFYMTAATAQLTLKNCVVQDWEANRGGAVYTSKGTFTADNVVFRNNSANDYDGVYFCSGTNATLTDCTMTGNTCKGAGPSVMHIETSSTAVMNGCTITDNTRTTSKAKNAALQVRGTSSRLTIGGQTVIRNNKDIDGAEHNVTFNTAFSTSTKNNALYVDGLTAGTDLTVTTISDAGVLQMREDANTLLIAGPNQTTWDESWITYTNKAGDFIAREGDGFVFIKHHHDDDAAGAEWVKWGDDAAEKTSLPKTSGNYLLVDDINPTASITLKSSTNIKICLNGKTITAPEASRLYYTTNESSGNEVHHTFKFCDCSASYDANGALQAGKIIPGSLGVFMASMATDLKTASTEAIFDHVIIDGEGININAQYSMMSTGHSTCTIRMSDCVVRNCVNSFGGAGGPIRISGSGHGFFDNVLFENNGNTSTTGKGGVIMVGSSSTSKGYVEITDSTFKNNTCAGNGGVIYQNSGTTTVENTTFEGNSAQYGGAIYQGTGTTTLTNVDFVKNATTLAYDSTVTYPQYKGGGALNSQGGTVNIHGGSFDGNTSLISGAAIYSANSTQMTIDQGTTFTNNVADIWGAGILSSKSTIKIDGATFTDNEAKGDRGGAAIYMENNSTVTLKDTVVTDNRCTKASTYNNGAIRVQATSTTLKVTGNTIIKGNYANNVECNISYTDKFTSTSTGKNRLNVFNLGPNARMSVLYTPGAPAAADLIVVASDNYKPTEATWNENWIYIQNAGDGKRIAYSDAEGKFVFADQSTHAHEDDQDGTQWTAWNTAGKLPTTSGHYYLTTPITLNTSSEIVATGEEDIVICLNGYNINGVSKERTYVMQNGVHLTVCDCTATKDSNGMLISSGVVGHRGDVGGAFYVRADNANDTRNTVLTLQDVIVDGGKQKNASYNGGAIRLEALATGTAARGEIYIDGCIVRNGSASRGGGVYMTNSHNGYLEVSNTVFDNNIAESEHGGALYVGSTSEVLLDNVDFTNNAVASTATADYRNGSAIFVNNATLDATDCTFTGNSTPGNGTLDLWAGATATLTNCSFDGNTAGAGGAVQMDNGNLTVIGGSFTNNTAKSKGGAIRAYDGTELTITGTSKNPVVFSGNRATGEGGALSIDAKFVDQADLNYVRFEDNSANSTGGAIATGSPIRIRNGALTGNSTDKKTGNNGSALYLNKTSLVMNNVQVTNNVGGSVATMFLMGNGTAGDCSATLTNVTVTGNTATQGAGVWVEYSMAATLDDCTIQNNVSNKDGAVYLMNKNSSLAIKGKTVITNNTTADGVANNLFLNNHTSGMGFVTLSAMETGAKIGVTAGGFKSTSDIKVAEADSTYMAGILAPDSVENEVGITNNITGNADDKHMLYAEAEVDGSAYKTMIDAMPAIKDGSKIQLNTNVADLALPAGAAVTIDTNGNTVDSVSGASKITLIDSKTNDYNVDDGEGYGKIKITDATLVPSGYQKADGMRYVVLDEGEGYYSAHRVYVNITAKSLRPNNTDPQIGFQARFGGDSKVLAAATGYGVKLQVNGQTKTLDVDVIAIDGNKNRKMDGQVLYFTIGDIMKLDASATENNTRAGYTIVGTPYITIGEQMIDATSAVEANMKAMFNYANTNFAKQSAVSQRLLGEMYTAFDDVITTANGWSFNKIKAAIQ